MSRITGATALSCADGWAGEGELVLWESGGPGEFSPDAAAERHILDRACTHGAVPGESGRGAEPCHGRSSPGSSNQERGRDGFNSVRATRHGHHERAGQCPETFQYFRVHYCPGAQPSESSFSTPGGPHQEGSGRVGGDDSPGDRGGPAGGSQNRVAGKGQTGCGRGI